MREGAANGKLPLPSSLESVWLQSDQAALLLARLLKEAEMPCSRGQLPLEQKEAIKMATSNHQIRNRHPYSGSVSVVLISNGIASVRTGSSKGIPAHLNSGRPTLPDRQQRLHSLRCIPHGMPC